MNRDKDFEWLRVHGAEHQGSWVALHEGQLLAAAPTLKELLGMISPEDRAKRPLFHRLLKEDEPVLEAQPCGHTRLDQLDLATKEHCCPLCLRNVVREQLYELLILRMFVFLRDDLYADFQKFRGATLTTLRETFASQLPSRHADG